MRRLTSVILLTGVLCIGASAATTAQSPEPPPYPEGTGVTFEAVAPSVWRASEPAWDCGREYPRQPFYDGADVAADGRLWFLDPVRGVRELGACPIAEPKPTFGIRDQALGPDGTVWLLNDDRLWSWDGSDWHVRLEGFNQPGRVPDGSGGYSYSTDCEAGPCYLTVDVAPDGTVWLGGTVLTAFDGTRSTDYLSSPTWIAVVGFGPEGTVWARSADGLYAIRPSGEPSSAEPATEPTATPPTAEISSRLGSILESITGVPPEVETWSGPDWVARYDPARHTEALMAAAHAGLEHLTIATALIEPTPGNYASVAAVHIPGTSALELVEPLITAMAPQIAEPTTTWTSLDGRWIARVADAAMPGVYPVTLYPSGDVTWVLQADRPLVETIVALLHPQELAGEPASLLPCGMLEAAFRQDFTTGDADRDREYLTRCVTCDELFDLVNYARVADVAAGMAYLADRCGGPPEPPPSSPGRPDETGRVEVDGSGFAIAIPEGWTAEITEHGDVFGAGPGAAWEPLRASDGEKSMACSVAVGVTDLPRGQWFGTGQDGVMTPYWDSDEPGLLWVPTPTIPETTSVHSTDWGRHSQQDPDLEHDVLYSLLCVADDARAGDPGRTFEQLMTSFEFLPAKG